MNDEGRDCGSTETTNVIPARVVAMYGRMQTPEFAAAAFTLLNEPLRVPVPTHLTRGMRGRAIEPDVDE